MKSTLRSKSLVVVALSFSVMSSANAFMGIGDVVTDPILTGKTIAAEAARLGQTVEMINNQINAYQNMLRNTLSLANPVLGPIGSLARTAANTYYRSQSLMYQAQNLDQAFGYMYPSYGNYQSYLMNVGRGGQTLEAKYQEWSDKGYNNVRTALQAANLQADNMDKDSDMLERLVQQANSTGGQVQALQGISHLMGQQSKQMSGLQDLMLTQVRMQANFYGQEIERRSAFDASLQNFKTPRSITRTGMGY